MKTKVQYIVVRDALGLNRQHRIVYCRMKMKFHPISGSKANWGWKKCFTFTRFAEYLTFHRIVCIVWCLLFIFFSLVYFFTSLKSKTFKIVSFAIDVDWTIYGGRQNSSHNYESSGKYNVHTKKNINTYIICNYLTCLARYGSAIYVCSNLIVAFIKQLYLNWLETPH